MIDELYIDGQKCDISDTGITLEYKSNIFGELDKFESSYSFTIKLPKTDRNVRIIEAADIVSNAGRFPFIKHGGRLLRDGVVIADNATVYITGTTTEAINVALTFNTSAAIAVLSQLKELGQDLRDLIYPSSAIPWGTADAVNGAPKFYPAARFGLSAADRGLTPPVIYVGESSRFEAGENFLRALFDGALLGALKIPAQDIAQLYDLTRDWVLPLLSRNENTAFRAKLQPVIYNSSAYRSSGVCVWRGMFTMGGKDIFSLSFGDSLTGGVNENKFPNNTGTYWGRYVHPYFRTQVSQSDAVSVLGFDLSEGQNEPIKMRISGRLIVAFGLRGSIPFDEYPESITIGVLECKRVSGGAVTSAPALSDVAVVSFVTSAGYADASNTREFYFDFGDSGEIGDFTYEAGKTYLFYVGYADGTPITFETDRGYDYGPYINLVESSGNFGDIIQSRIFINFEIDEISPTSYTPTSEYNSTNYRANVFYEKPNVPKIKQFDFFKALLDMTGLIAMTSSHDASGYGLRLLTLRQIIGNAEDWTARLIDATPEQEFKVSDFARLNWFKFKEAAEADGNVPTNDAALAMDAPSVTEEKTAIELPFAASKNSGGVAFAKVYTYEASNEDGKVVETAEFEAREEAVPIWEVDANTNTARASLTWRRLLDENYKEFAAILKEPRTIKAKVRMTAADLSLLRYDTAKYFRQFGARFLLISLRTQSGSEICTAELVKVPASLI